MSVRVLFWIEYILFLIIPSVPLARQYVCQSPHINDAIEVCGSS